MKNEVTEIDSDTVGIILESEKHGTKTCIIDREDLPRVRALNKWFAVQFYNGAFYCSSNVCRGGSIVLHRLILSFPEGLSVDHINGNGLDNRKANLRACAQSDNMKNRKPNNSKSTKGVLQIKKTGKWSSKISANKVKYHLGHFDTKEEAVSAYNEMAIKLHGEFARVVPIT